MLRRALLLLPAALVAADEEAALRDWLGEWIARLTEENPDEFLRAMDQPLREQLEAGVYAIVRVAEVSSSVTILEIRGEGPRRELELDWYLDLRFRALATRNEKRRETVILQVQRTRKKGWMVTGFTPPSLLGAPRG